MSNLSDYWRKYKSQNKVLEMMSIADGVHGCFSLMKGKSQIQWGHDGQSYQSGNLVQLDIGMLDNQVAPYKGKLVDVVIGLALHEVGHEKWTGTLDLDVRFNNMVHIQHDHASFQTVSALQNVLEDAFIDQTYRKKSEATSGYIRASREYFRPDDYNSKASAAMQQAPTRENVTAILSAIILYGVPIPHSIDSGMKKVLLNLLHETQQYIKLRGKKARVMKTWDIWEKHIKGLPSFADALPMLKQMLQQAAQSGGTGQGQGLGSTTSKPQQEEDSGEKASGSKAKPKAAPKQEDEDDEEEGAGAGKAEKEDEAKEDEEQEEGAGEDEDNPEDDDDAGDDTEDGDKGEEPREESTEDPLISELHPDTGGTEPGLLDNLSVLLQQRQMRGLRPEEKEEMEKIAQVADILKDLEHAGFSPNDFQLTKATYDAKRHTELLSNVRKEVKRMRKVFSVIEEEEARWRFGLREGKLDARRLSKVGCGKDTVFKHRDFKSRPKMALALVLDVSSSMSHQMGVVFDTATIFHEALKRVQGIWFTIHTYTSGHGYGRTAAITNLSSTGHDLCLRNVETSGGTPSGEAIAHSVVILKNRPERKKLIIHFTDGSPDRPDLVRKAVDLAKENNIETLGISDESSVVDMYDHSKLIHSIPELAGAVQELLKKLYKGGTCR